VHTINEFSSLMVLTNEKSSSIIALQNLIKATKNQAPNGFPVFADL
jgi:hypothetical protein